MNKRFQWSKILTAAVVVLVYGFVVFACVEMHRQNDLSPIAYIGTAIIGLLATVISAYMWRAKQQDVFTLEMKKAEAMAKLRQKYGDALKDEETPEHPRIDDDLS